MKLNRLFILCVFVVLLGSGMAHAGQVQVFMPSEEDLSPMALRNKAMAESFALAVLDEAKLMLPGEMDEVRSELFKNYMTEHAKPYIQGYKILSSQASEEGIILSLDVRVNKKVLRDGLKSMGLFSTSTEPLAASVAWPEDLDEESLVKVQELLTLTGIQVVQGVFPSFVFEPGPEKTFKGRLELEDQEWMSINKDMSVVWFDLWGRYFNKSEGSRVQADVKTLSVGGWFSPDAALEFDRVLKGWDSAVQEVKLVELDMQPTGVGGLWEFRLLDAGRLEMLLGAYLPQRGLTYQLSEDIEQ